MGEGQSHPEAEEEDPYRSRVGVEEALSHQVAEEGVQCRSRKAEEGEEELCRCREVVAVEALHHQGVEEDRLGSSKHVSSLIYRDG